MSEHTSKFVVLGGTILVFLVFVAIGRSSVVPNPPTTTVSGTADTTTSLASPPTTTPGLPQPSVTSPDVAGWTRLQPGDLGARTRFSASLAGNRFVVWGGNAFGGNSYMSGGWSHMAPAPIRESENPITLWNGSEMFAYTGETAAWDPVANTWRTVDDPPLGGDTKQGIPLTGVLTDTGAVIVGVDPAHGEGESNLFVSGYSMDFHFQRQYDPPPFSLTYAEAFWTGSEVLIIGSDTRHPNRLPVAGLDPSTGQWTRYGSMPFPDPFPLAAAWTGDSLIAWDRSTRAFEWTPDDRWVELPSVPVDEGTCNPIAEAFGSSVFVSLCGQVALWDEGADRWVRVVAPTIEDGYPNSGCDAVARPTPATQQDWRILLWCSSIDGTSFWSFDPSAYEPAAFSAPAITAGSNQNWELLPNPRIANLADTTLVWSGTELLWFGGHGTTAESVTGWGYDPARGTHHRIPASPYPGRYGQSAVMADGEMYILRGPMTVWNPATLEWRTTSPSPQPLALEPNLVWTGERIIAFGSDDSPTSRGAVYNPQTDSWQTMSAPPQPETQDQVVAWSGSHLYIFGGASFAAAPVSSSSFSGARYDLSRDRWEKLPPVPEGVDLTTSAGDWVGTELVVIGEDISIERDPDNASPLRSVGGLAYSPTEGTWRNIREPDPIDIGQLAWSRAISATEHLGELAVYFPAPPDGGTSRLGFYDPTTNLWRYIDGPPTTVLAPDLVSGITSTGVPFIAFLTPDGTVIVYDD